MSYYLDSQRTLTRRDSSLITPKPYGPANDLELISFRGLYATPRNESTTSVALRPRGAIQKEIVSMMFESMLDFIVESWTVLEQKVDETLDKGSQLTITSKKKKTPQPKVPKSKRSRSAALLATPENIQIDPMQIIWWSAPDEKAVIRFKNGNLYEGYISSKCMHGNGRFQWADGTVYLGMFKDNEINDQGLMQWKDDTWYEGEFAGNIRHGRGLYVDSRRQRSYSGRWHYGSKHGEGAIFYNKTFRNSYDGLWIHNQRFGFGSREYSVTSGYKGEWERNIREGKGMMIWPNHDFYRGGWKNGVMSGNGIYIWDTNFNNSMSLPSLCAYRGQWEKGERHGYGHLNLGVGLGSFYKGEFKNNKKHGVGKFVTNNGHIIQSHNIFIDGNIETVAETPFYNAKAKSVECLTEPSYKFEMCDSTVGLLYHVDQALKNLDNQEEIIKNMINDYMENNKINVSSISNMEELEDLTRHDRVENLIAFEQESLHRFLKYYERELTNIYFKYAKICNTEEIRFTPVLIRLYLWQLYYDCHIHEKGLTLAKIDELYHQNPEWLSNTPHNPFEKIYYWQFLHSLIAVASKLYAKKQLPVTKPDTILANAFRTFMENDVLPGSKKQRGKLVSGYGAFVPLTSTYELYRSLGEPHTIRTFLCAVRRPPHLEPPQATLVEELDDLPLGRNSFVFGDELSFVVENYGINDTPKENTDNLKLFNFCNLSSKTILQIFASIIPQVCNSDKIINLDIPLTFFDFFEAFIICAEKSIEVEREEIKWQEVLVAERK